MIQNLTAYGVARDSWNWFCTYLDSRSQYVQLQGETSEQKSITVGIPQGSILGHLLFTLNVNDFPECVDNSVDIYADDGTLQAMQKILKLLKINYLKCLLKQQNG